MVKMTNRCMKSQESAIDDEIYGTAQSALNDHNLPDKTDYE